MSWDFLRREWGAVTFVLTVLIGLVVVPLALYLGSQSVAPVSLPSPSPSPSVAAYSSPSP